MRLLVAILAVVVCVSQADARPRLICGWTQRIYYGIKDASFNLALHWAVLPHTSPQPGAVVVQRRRGHAIGGGPGGHVSRIVSVIGSCRAMVVDERGEYGRNICKNLVAYVLPNSAPSAKAGSFFNRESFN